MLSSGNRGGGLSLRLLLMLSCMLLLASMHSLSAMPNESGSCQSARPLHSGGSRAGKLSYRVVRKLPHDSTAFTQGLTFDGVFIYESTGIRGHSTLRRLDPVSGDILRQNALPDKDFGEGLAFRDGYLIQLTWQSGMASIYATQDMEMRGYFHYMGEGWGLVGLPEGLLLSDGSNILRYLDFFGDDSGRRLAVTDAGEPVAGINELELANGIVYANVWPGNCIAAIDQDSGKVLAWIDLSPLQPSGDPDDRERMANGIAYNSARRTFYVTGKYWPYLYEIALWHSSLH